MTGSTETDTFRDHFTAVFDAGFARLYRYLDRLSGDPDLAADLAQDAFARLFQRGSLPDAPDAWLVSVAMNLFRNVRTMDARHRRLLTVARAEDVSADPPPSPAQITDDANETLRVRAALDRVPERNRQILLLRAEDYSYREIAEALGLAEASIGTQLARAKRAFRDAYEQEPYAPR